jgi:hypothetical protein
MRTETITGLKIRYDNGIEALFRTYEFLAASPLPKGLWMITVRERFFVFFAGKPQTFCGHNSWWRNDAGECPPIHLGLYLCQCWIAVKELRAASAQHTIHENPLQK